MFTRIVSILLFVAFAATASAQQSRLQQPAAQSQPTATLILGAPDSLIISRHIYGQFAEHLGRSVYDGFYRNGKIRMDIVEALRQIKIPNLRWPGGCYADQYHWKNGIGLKAKRPETVNTTWGMVPDDNSFGTHEFLELCRLLNTEPYIAGNVGTGSPQEMQAWIEYLNYTDRSALTRLRAANGHPQPYRVSWWGVGNESWGCGGSMSPEHYADLYKQFAAFCFDYPGASLKKIISGANADDYHWTETVLQKLGSTSSMSTSITPDLRNTYDAYGLSLHYYTFPTGRWRPRGSATRFTDEEYAQTLVRAAFIDTLIAKHAKIMDRYDPLKRLALVVDEWGVWTDPEPGTPPYAMFQQNSLRDALAAALTLNVFNNHCDRVRGANLAQTVNVIHSLVLTRGDTMLLTPTYYVFDLYKVHQDARHIPVTLRCADYSEGRTTIPILTVSASEDSTGTRHITIANLDPHHNTDVQTNLVASEHLTGQVVTSENVTDCNTFEKPDLVRTRRFDGFRQDAAGKLILTIPAKSIILLEIRKK